MEGRRGLSARLRGLRFPDAAAVLRFRTRLLELHPVVWLAGRHWLRSWLVWVTILGAVAGYAGLAVVIDEAETILRMRSDSRHKSLNGIRQIADAAASYPGMLWLFTGTPEFFDTRHGVAGLAPLHDRIRFLRQGRFASLRQAQLELVPFDADRLRAVATHLREIFPSANPAHLAARIHTAFIDRLVDEVTKGFKGDVGVVPRQFLREFVTQLDLVEENDDYDPEREYGFQAQALSPEEQQALAGKPAFEPDGESDLVPAEDVW